jgi:hypothetical protein
LREEEDERVKEGFPVDVPISFCGMGKVGPVFANPLVQKGKDFQKRVELNLKAVAAVDLGGRPF